MGASSAGLAGGSSVDKPRLLADYAACYEARTLVETGIYRGVGSGMGLAGRLRYIAVDWQEENIDRVRGEGFEGYLGDSPAVLTELMGRLESPVLFWLDAHALSEDEGAPQVCPVLGELAAILTWPGLAARSVVLIDDLWGFGSLPGWPTLPELREAADAGPWERDEADGIMRLTPKS